MVGSYLWHRRTSVFSAYPARFRLYCLLFLLWDASPDDCDRQRGPSNVSALLYMNWQFTQAALLLLLTRRPCALQRVLPSASASPPASRDASDNSCPIRHWSSHTCSPLYELGVTSNVAGLCSSALALVSIILGTNTLY